MFGIWSDEYDNDDDCFYVALFSALEHSLRLHMILHERPAFPKWCTYSAGMAGATWNCCRLGASSVYTIQSCTSVRRQFYFKQVCGEDGNRPTLVPRIQLLRVWRRSCFIQVRDEDDTLALALRIRIYIYIHTSCSVYDVSAVMSGVWRKGARASWRWRYVWWWWW